MAYVKENDKALYDEILVMKIRLNDLWRSMREGKDTLEQYEEALRTCKELHLKAVELYKGWRAGPGV
jgi:hypothetical protein